jgi:hypothetical protein
LILEVKGGNVYQILPFETGRVAGELESLQLFSAALVITAKLSGLVRRLKNEL